jgi:surfeit locus 1 family protein
MTATLPPRAPPTSGRGVPLLPTLIVAAAVATMIALGVWQLGRADEKAALIARYGQAQAMSSNVPWPANAADMEGSLFRWSQFTCAEVRGIRSGAGTSADGLTGWQHTARCRLPDGSEAEVALGWSTQPQPPEWAGGEVSGIIGPGGQHGGVLYMAQAAPGLQPLAPPDPNDLPNNHMAYAGQWFFFALTAGVIYVLALRRRLRG